MFERLEASPRAGRVTASLWIAPYCDPPKQPSSGENAWLSPFAGLRGSRTQSTSRCRALAARVDDAVLTAWFSRTRSQHCLGVCNPRGVCNPLSGCLQSLCNPRLRMGRLIDLNASPSPGLARELRRQRVNHQPLPRCQVGVLIHRFHRRTDRLRRRRRDPVRSFKVLFGCVTIARPAPIAANEIASRIRQVALRITPHQSGGSTHLDIGPRSAGRLIRRPAKPHISAMTRRIVSNTNQRPPPRGLSRLTLRATTIEDGREGDIER